MICWARTLFILIVVTLGVLGMISACGQKGPLYLPDDKPAKTAAAGADVPQVQPDPQPSAASSTPH